MNEFDPKTDSNALRAAFGMYSTGVTLVTTMTANGPLGITANSFTSVSLDPPMILWCPACASLRHDAFVNADRFAIHILAANQGDLARGFAKSGDAFDLCDWTGDGNGLPLIENCAARFLCTTETRLLAGDHSVILAHVKSAATGDRTPLVFSNGRYGSFTAS